MGNISSRLEDAPALFLKDQTRLSIASLQITNAKKRILLNITPNAFPGTRTVVKRDIGDESLVEFVQDPDPSAYGSGLLLKITNEDELYFNFTFNARQRLDEATGAATETNIAGLTYVFASNHKELDNLVTREFHADPNLHKNPSVSLVGDFATEKSPAVAFEWTWKWKSPTGAEEKNSGFRNTCSFVEYDQRNHRLVILAEFSVWVQNSPRNFLMPPSPGNHGTFDQRILPKQRMGSHQSYNTQVSEGGYDSGNELISPGTADETEIPVPLPPPIKVDINCLRPAEDYMGDDGPLFRATMKGLESKTALLRQKMKKVLKKAEHARDKQGEYNDAMKEFIESLREAASTNAPGIKPAMEHYFNRAAKDILSYERQTEIGLQKFVIAPLDKLYSQDIKQAEAKKEDFDKESREFYSYVSKYLGMRTDSSSTRKKTESDSKYQTKRRNFEIKRFDYGSFMQDLHGGRKEQEVLSHLTKFADAQAKSYMGVAKKIQDNMAHLEALSREVKEMDKEYQMQRTEREERRRGLEMNTTTFVEPDSVTNLLSPGLASNNMELGTSYDFNRSEGGPTIRAVSGSNMTVTNSSQNDSNATLVPSSAGTLSSSAPAAVPTSSGSNTAPNKFRGIRDLEEKDYTAPSESEPDRRKEGLLWALSRPGSHADPKGLNKQAWHKYWVVLAGGQLCEYSNWKQKLDLHNEPINLRMASAREARSSDRRFCFEVITPQYKRVYQGTSEEDMNIWINAINNAVKGTLEGGRSTANFDTSRLEDEPGRRDKDISSVFGGGRNPSFSHHHHSPGHGNSSQMSNSSNLHRRITVGSKPLYRGSTYSEDPEKLLQLVRESDPGNSSCADCGSQTKTEWVSINLGIVLCIECSGIHRSLGTHISKVRSLTLDVTSFTPDLTDLLLHAGNTISNNIYEARLEPGIKPQAASSRETRLKFITAKYADRAFVRALTSSLSPDATSIHTMLNGVRNNDISQVLHALALRADSNYIDNNGRHVIYLALLAAEPLKSSAQPSPSTSPTSKVKTPTFPIAELFFQNGGTLESAPIVPLLAPAATNYLATKASKSSGSTAVNIPGQGISNNISSQIASRMSGTNAGGGAGGDGYSPLEREKRDREERLRKRVSTSGRVVSRAQPLDGHK